MERHELEQWLCGPDSTPPSPAAIAEALGLPFDALADTTLLRTLARVRSLRFTLAVLHDVFPADRDVCRWLETPRKELGGVSARTALVAGKATLVEGLAVRAWNGSVCMAGAA